MSPTSPRFTGLHWGSLGAVVSVHMERLKEDGGTGLHDDVTASTSGQQFLVPARLRSSGAQSIAIFRHVMASSNYLTSPTSGFDMPTPATPHTRPMTFT